MGKNEVAEKSKTPADMPVGKIKKLLENFFAMGRSGKPGPEMARFEITAGEMVEKRGAVVMGRVHLVNLRDLIVKRSENPDETLERAEKIAEAVINDHLEEGDVFARGEEGAFFYCFQASPRKRAS